MLIRLLNYVFDCLVLNEFRDIIKGVKNIDISLIEFSDVLSGSDVW